MYCLSIALALNGPFSLSNALGGLHYERCTTLTELKRFERGVRSLDSLSLRAIRVAYKSYIASSAQKSYHLGKAWGNVAIPLSKIRNNDLAVINRYLFAKLSGKYPVSTQSWFGPCSVLEYGRLWHPSQKGKRLKLWAYGSTYGMSGFDAIAEFDYWSSRSSKRYRTRSAPNETRGRNSDLGRNGLSR